MSTFNTIEDAEVIVAYKKNNPLIFNCSVSTQQLMFEIDSGADLLASSCAIADFAIEQAKKSPN